MKDVSRRDFLKSVSGGVAGIGLIGAAVPSVHAQVRGANETIRLAVIGLGAKGKNHIKAISPLPKVRIAALCDPDQKVLAQCVKDYASPENPMKGYQDMRRIFDRSNIDAVIISTPNHWHALATIWACQAGKDVYVEKPASHSVWEGTKMVQAAQKYNRIVQVGTQMRSCIGFREARQFIREGHLGELKSIYGLWYNIRPSIGKIHCSPMVPSHIDYNLWAGPAPLVPLPRKKFHYDWHWQWPTGNGDMGNLGAHIVDGCRWVLGGNDLPDRVMSFGGRFGFSDDGQTPNTHVAVFDYKPAPIIVEMRNLPAAKGLRSSDHYRKIREGAVYQCERGYFSGGRGGGWAYDNQGKKIKQFIGDGGHKHPENFFQAMRSRKKEELHAEISDGIISAVLCHMSNISWRIGKIADPAETRQMLEGVANAPEAFDRMPRHLARNEIDTVKTPLIAGPWLTLNKTFNQFTNLADRGNQKAIAEAILKGSYRKPFVVPPTV